MLVYFFFQKEKKTYEKNIPSYSSPLTKPYPFLLKHYYCFNKTNKSFEKHKEFIIKNKFKTILETN